MPLENNTMKVDLPEDGVAEINFLQYKPLGVMIELLNPTNLSTPLGAIARLNVYRKNRDSAEIPFEYGGGYILCDGKIIKFGDELSEYNRTHPRS